MWWFAHGKETIDCGVTTKNHELRVQTSLCFRSIRFHELTERFGQVGARHLMLTVAALVFIIPSLNRLKA
jgi:hypothetical protein